MKLLIIVAALIGSAFGACTGSSPTRTSTPDLASVQACVTASISGDTVNVSAGSATWAGDVTATKAIHIHGAGSGGGGTIITTGGIVFSPSVGEEVKVFELDGFDFEGNRTHFNLTGWGHLPAITQLNVHNNAFNGVSGGRAIWLAGLEFGVFHHNSFSGDSIAISIIGASSASVTSGFTFGSASYPYFEDNTFGDGTGGNFVWETGQWGRIAFRHNTITGYTSGPGSEVFDAHGEQGSGGWTVSTELYHNTIGVGAQPFRWMHLRGGQAVIMNNTVSRNIGFNITEYQAWGGNGICNAYPVAYNAAETYCSPISGSCYETQIHNSFFYNNISGGSSQTPTYTQGDGGSCGADPPWGDNTFVQQNREFWIPTFGLESALPGTCTANGNTYYGTTDSDKIFKCTSTNTWTAYFTPYTYPHPLQGLAGIPVAAFAPTLLTFANQNIGTSSPTQGISLSNIGTATMNISSIVVTGANASDFSQSNTCASTLAVSASCTITVTFTPTGVGGKIASITVTSDSSNSPTVAGLSGTGIIAFSRINGVSIGGNVSVH